MNSTLIKLYGFFAGVALIAFLFTGNFAGAQEPTPQALSARDQSRIINLAANMTSKLEATNDRLEMIATKVKFNRDWMRDEEGFNFPDINQKLDRVDQLILENRTAAEQLHPEVYRAVSSTDPKLQWPAVKQRFIEFNSRLIEMRDLLSQVNTTLMNAYDNKSTSLNTGGTQTTTAATGTAATSTPI